MPSATAQWIDFESQTGCGECTADCALIFHAALGEFGKTPTKITQGRGPAHNGYPRYELL